jgi:hypothetical protein
MDGIFVRAALAKMPERNSFILVLWHDKGRSILVLEDNGSFSPLDKSSAGALADLLEDLV